MDSQDKSRSASPNLLNMVSNRMDVESNIPSNHGSPYGEEQALKIRKPYTITKQRERWSEEEHQKFLEALELYGRAWRRIEEHIGTKTAVQIRSHAQKFFTKVARESTVTGPSTMKPIVIPPPRPKRKPLNPYPRKLGNPSGKENPALEPLKSPFLSNTFVSNQENGSPTSVLSAFGSETMNSLLLNHQNNCTSPILSASGSNGHDNRSRVPKTSVDEENTSPFQGLPTGGITTQDQCAMDSDSGPDDGSGSEQSLLTRKQPSTLKLFGRTVLVSQPDKRPSTTVGIKMVQCSEPPPSSMIQSHSINIDIGLNSPIQSPHPTVLNRDHLESSIKGPWNIWAGGVPPMLYCLPLQKEPINPVHSGSVSVPWWSLYGNLMLPSIDPSKQVTDRSCREGLDDKDRQKEGSWTGSNTASFSGDTGDQNGDVLNSKKDEDIQDEGFAQLPVLRLSSGDKTATSPREANTGECKRGFVPYKRCAVEKEVRHP